MKIMVTLDGSSFAEAVVETAAQLAREAKLAEVSTWYGSSTHLMSVVLYLGLRNTKKQP